ncbi:hypothetical protein IEE_02315 [Bacillus cereus BAG5X1-1]|uniref:Pre-toxin TG domain-containing protein n=1 Tax=Bacillus cereus BAG5X1-1 TaxID=1053189 RepID=J8B319_BACCE|nr:hypothetical protein [Bacillus cereus]EJQ45434.1 hypothetical protein IEE_02315 [Bacillus cereus BAG5X1-1]PGY08592.1 hypothetical protein COE23_26715 [Bacillus cereus]
MGDKGLNKIGHVAKGAKASSGISTIANAAKLAKELKPTLEMLQSFKRDASYAFSSVGGTIITKIPQGELIEAFYKFAKSKDGGKGIDNTSKKTAGLDSSGEFLDDVLESKYQDYVKRNTKFGKNVRDRLEWKEASDKWAKLQNQGRDFELEKINDFMKVATDVQEQITIVTKDGTKIRVDAIGYDKKTGELLIEEYKSSATAPLTSNQRDGFVELLESGGFIVGEGKGIFIGGVEIPPGTAVQIIRPKIRE